MTAAHPTTQQHPIADHERQLRDLGQSVRTVQNGLEPLKKHLDNLEEYTKRLITLEASLKAITDNINNLTHTISEERTEHHRDIKSVEDRLIGLEKAYAAYQQVVASLRDEMHREVERIMRDINGIGAIVRDKNLENETVHITLQDKIEKGFKSHAIQHDTDRSKTLDKLWELTKPIVILAIIALLYLTFQNAKKQPQEVPVTRAPGRVVIPVIPAEP